VRGRGVLEVLQERPMRFHPLEGLVALPGLRPLVAEDFDLTGELRGSASAVLAVLRVLPCLAQRNVVVMPGTAPLSPLRVFDFVGPVRDFSESVPAGWLPVGEAIVPEELQDPCIGLRPGVAGGDFADHAMSLRAPGKS